MANFSVIYIKYGEKDTYARSGYIVVKNTTSVIIGLSDNGHGLPARSVCAVSHITEKMEQLIEKGKLTVISQPSDKRMTRPKKQHSQEQDLAETQEIGSETTESTAPAETFEEKTVADSPETEQL